MNRKVRPKKSAQQIKKEKINFLLEEVEKNLEQHRKAIELKDRQLSELKKVLQGAKKKLRFCVAGKKTLIKIYSKY